MIVLGTVLESLEEVVLEGVWDDKTFIDRLGKGFLRTRVIMPTFYGYIRTGNDSRGIFLKETEVIRRTLREGSGFLSFLTPENNKLLPRSIVALLDEDGEDLGSFLSLVVPMYEDAIKCLK